MYIKNISQKRVINSNANLKNQTYYFFNDVINIKDFDPNNIKIHGKSNKNILIYFIGYVTTKDWKYAKIKSLNPFQQSEWILWKK